MVSRLQADGRKRRVTLPLQLSGCYGSKVSGGAQGLRKASGTTRRVARVLIVDDDASIAEMLRQALSETFEATATTDPRYALATLASGDWYDVVLCDVMMPCMDGVELHDRVREVRPDLAQRIVFTTGGVIGDPLRLALSRLPNTILEKPFHLASLREMIWRRTASRPPSDMSSSRSSRR